MTAGCRREVALLKGAIGSLPVEAPLTTSLFLTWHKFHAYYEKVFGCPQWLVNAIRALKESECLWQVHLSGLLDILHDLLQGKLAVIQGPEEKIINGLESAEGFVM